MKTKSLLLNLAVCFLLLNVCISPPAFGGRIDLIVGHGVDKEAEAQARATVDGVFNFFQKTYGIGLQKDIRINLSCDKHSYKKAIMSEYGRSEASAARTANRSVGLQLGGTLLVDLGDSSRRNFKLFTLCHEIVHFYQAQESQDKHGSIDWICEGVAEVLAAHIMETVGKQSPGYWKEYWREGLKDARDWPRLENLHSSMGAPFAYDTSALAVLTLV